MPERFEFTVDRRTWLRGEGFSSRLLRKTDGKMCCMGSYCLARGLKPEEIEDVASVNSAVDTYTDSRMMGWEGALINSKCRVYGVNDTPTTDDVTREKQLAAALEPFGVDIKFIN